MILYDYVLSASCYKVRLMAALLGVPLDLRAVAFHPDRAHRAPDMLRLNPAGTLPVMVDGDLVLTETAAMLRHLAQGTAWRGDDVAVVDRWLDFAGALNHSLGMARLHDVLGYEGDIDALRRAGVVHLRQIEERLTEQRIDGAGFLAGTAPTIADIACFPNVALAPDGGVTLDPYPAIRAWMRGVRSLPRFIEMPGIHRLHDLVPGPLATGGAA